MCANCHCLKFHAYDHVENIKLWCHVEIALYNTIFSDCQDLDTKLTKKNRFLGSNHPLTMGWFGHPDDWFGVVEPRRCQKK